MPQTVNILRGVILWGAHRISSLSILVAALAVLHGQAVQGLALKDLPGEAEIHGLPGLEVDMPSRMFSGYVAVPHSQKRLFYVLVLSEGNPVSDPLILWYTPPTFLCRMVLKKQGRADQQHSCSERGLCNSMDSCMFLPPPILCCVCVGGGGGGV